MFKPFVALYNNSQQIIEWFELKTIYLMVQPFKPSLNASNDKKRFDYHKPSVWIGYDLGLGHICFPFTE
jgi:hypothetical protein